MKIVSLVENTSLCGFRAAHGLSLYIESSIGKILFDLGPDFTVLLENAVKAGIDLKHIDFVVISHGHYDHGGGLKGFMEYNETAKIFIHKNAFEPHYNITKSPRKYIGLDPELKNSGRITFTEDGSIPFEGAYLFTSVENEKCHSDMNDVLCDENGRDSFSHEQNLILSEDNKNVLFCGCGHRGIVNITEKAADFSPVACIGGFHLSNPTNGNRVSDSLLDEIAKSLAAQCKTEFYTCHCTGDYPYSYLSSRANNIHYLSCGETITI